MINKYTEQISKSMITRLDCIMAMSHRNLSPTAPWQHVTTTAQIYPVNITTTDFYESHPPKLIEDLHIPITSLPLPNHVSDTTLSQPIIPFTF